MRILYLDLVGGISGDMTVAALIDLGVPLERLRDALRAVGLTEVSLATERAARHQIAGTRFLVQHTQGAPADLGTHAGHTHGHEHTHQHRHTHEHSHAHTHDHGHSHEDTHDHGHEHGHGHTNRAYRDIRAMLAESTLAPAVRELAERVFARLAAAEGAVHGVPAEDVTFHEVGAWDSIADIVCTAAGMAYLAPDVVYCSPVPAGSGFVRSAHGNMPVPTPATLLLLRDFPTVQGGPAYERTTPTGAAILAALATPAPEPLAYTPRAVGVGLGTKDPAEVPNLLRAVLGDVEETASLGAAAPAAGAPTHERVEVAEANLDDASPEWIGYLQERLLAAGALDVVLLPAQMKKNRPGTLVQVLYRPAQREAMLDVLFAEGTTLGVRYSAWERAVLAREAASVETAYGPIAGKVASYGARRRFTPEYEACRSAAQAHGVPLQEVYRAAQAAWRG